MREEKKQSDSLLRQGKETIEQDVSGYSRHVELVDFICKCPNCPFCSNEAFYAHINRKYCSPEAMLHHRQIARKLEALKSGRKPGQVGRPRKNVPQQILFVFQASGSNFFKVGFGEDQQEFERILNTENAAIPRGIDIILKAQQPYCKESVEVIYDIYSRYVVNGEWIELSEIRRDELIDLLS